MDSFSTSQQGGTAQAIPDQQIFTQPVATPTLSPVQQPPQKQKSFRKFLNLGTWIFLFALLPITILIFLSQDSIPGDFFYPVKRGMENAILVAASVNPATRAAFRTDLTETRFKEAQSLVISKSNASGLTTFIDEVQDTQLEVASLKSDIERGKAEEKLLAKIDQYQNGLSTLQAKTEENIIAYNPQGNVSPTLTPVPPTVTSNQIQPPQNLPSSTLTLTPTPITAKILISTPTPIPTSTPTLTLVPTVVSTISVQRENTQIEEQKRIAETIRETKTTLDKIKKDLEEKRGENKNENIQRSVKSNEDENKNKDNSNKKTETPNREK